MAYIKLEAAMWDDMLQAAAVEAGTTRERARAIMQAIGASIADAMRINNDYPMPGIGTFTVTKRAARYYRDPRTGQTVRRASRKITRFRLTPYMLRRLKTHGFAP